jgi:hypothetical protein
MTEDAIVTAGGWCAPTSLVYDAMSLRSNEFTTASMFPDVRISREWKQPTPEEILARETFARFAVRTAERLARMRHEAIESAAREALANGWDLHVYHPPQPFDLRRASERDLLYLRQVGIAFTEQKYVGLPTIHEHQCPDWWDDDD